MRERAGKLERGNGASGSTRSRAIAGGNWCYAPGPARRRSGPWSHGPDRDRQRTSMTPNGWSITEPAPSSVKFDVISPSAPSNWPPPPLTADVGVADGLEVEVVAWPECDPSRLGERAIRVHADLGRELGLLAVHRGVSARLNTLSTDHGPERDARRRTADIDQRTLFVLRRAGPAKLQCIVDRSHALLPPNRCQPRLPAAAVNVAPAHSEVQCKPMRSGLTRLSG
jgi:hypothetical protein